MPGRQCSVCAIGTDTRRQVDAALMTGSSFRTISQQFELSPDAVRRHLLNHVSDDVKAAIAEGQSIDGVGLVLQIASIASDAKDTRETLKSQGKTLEALRAGDSELKALSTIVTRLNISDSDLLHSATEAVELGLSVAAIMRSHPEIDLGNLLVEELRDRGSDAMADAFTTLISRNKEVTAA